MRRRAIIFFLKAPERGRVKTRLAESVGDDFAYQIYGAFLRDIGEKLSKLDADTAIALSGFSDTIDEFVPTVPCACFKQKGDDLGERMFNAFTHVFMKGYSRGVMIGADSPDLSPDIIHDAFLALDGHDAVIGPSSDGGYYLIGFRHDTLVHELFTGISWSTRFVFEQTVRNADERGIGYHLLPEWDDIDDIDDLRNFYRRNKARGIVTTHTMRFLMNNREYIREKI